MPKVYWSLYRANLMSARFLGFRFLVEHGSSSLGLTFTVAFFGFSSGPVVPNFFLLRWRRARFMDRYLRPAAASTGAVATLEAVVSGDTMVFMRASKHAVISLNETTPISWRARSSMGSREIW